MAPQSRQRRRGVELGRLLLACTREHDWERPLDRDRLGSLRFDVRLLVERARLHGVESCVHLSLRFEESLDGEVRAELENSYHSALHVHLRAQHDLGIAGAALDRAGIAWASFKGPVLAEHIYRRHDLRSYSDLDLLVPPARLRDAIAALERSGGTLLDRNWRLVRERMNGEVHVRLPTGTVADLHWHLFNDQETRRSFPARTDDVLSRAIVVELNDTPTRTLSAEDTLVQLALHACRSGGTRLLWCKDLEQAVMHQPIDWDAAVGRALEWHAGPPTALMLGAASSALEFALPHGVLSRLSPGRFWRGLAWMGDRWSPPERWSGGRSIRRDLCLASRGNDLASAVALARRTASLVKRRDLGAPHQTDRDPSHPASLLHPTTDPGDRTAFFAALEALPEAGLPAAPAQPRIEGER